MVMRTVMRNVRADLVQTRSPGEFLRVALVLGVQRSDLGEEGGADVAHPLALRLIGRKAVCQPAHGALANVTAVGVAVDQVVQRAVAQRAAQLGLGVRALSAYARPPARCNGLVLGYGSLDEGAVEGAVASLKRAVGA